MIRNNYWPFINPSGSQNTSTSSVILLTQTFFKEHVYIIRDFVHQAEKTWYGNSSFMLTKSMLYVMTLYICDVNIVLDGFVLVFLMISHQNEYDP